MALLAIDRETRANLRCSAIIQQPHSIESSAAPEVALEVSRKKCALEDRATDQRTKEQRNMNTFFRQTITLSIRYILLSLCAVGLSRLVCLAQGSDISPSRQYIVEFRSQIPTDLSSRVSQLAIRSFGCRLRINR